MPQANATQMIVAGIILILVVLLVVGPLIYWIRRRALSGEIERDGQMSRGSIEEMRRRGLISDKEFSRLRRLALKLDTSGKGEENPKSLV